MKKKDLLFIVFLALGFLPFPASSQGFKISGNQLLDANGTNFVIKGTFRIHCIR